MRKAFTNSVSKVITNNKNSALLLGDIGVFSFKNLIERYPERAMNLGILEQSMIGVAAGLSSKGIIPIVHTIAPFIAERALEQIKIDFGYQKLPGNLVSVGASYDYAALGCTHHCPADVSVLSTIPGIKIYVPGTPEEFSKQFEDNWDNGSLNYWRLSETSNSASNFSEDMNPKIIKIGSLATILVVGPILDIVNEAIKDLDVGLVYLNQVNRIEPTFLRAICGSEKIIIIEPFYSGPTIQLLNELLMEKSLRILQIGVPQKFLTNYGSSVEHSNSIGFNTNSIQKKIESFISG